jgi:hypothetical protein
MKSHELRQKHEDAISACHSKAGNRIAKGGGILYFNGPAYWKAMEETGHTSSFFEDCACHWK